MKLTYICTNFNNSKFTIAAVSSLIKNFGHDIRVYVVDNASKESERARLLDLQSNNKIVRIVQNKINVGYFAGLNLGILAALKDDSEATWMVVGNNDLEFSSDFCNNIIRNMDEYQKYSVISPDVVTLDGQHQNPHVISKISSIREIFYDIYYSNYQIGLLVYKVAKLFKRFTRRGDENHWENPRPIYQGHGSCYLLTPKFFSQFDALSNPTFMMHEEVFLSLQLSKVGEQVFYSPAIKVTHHWHGSLQNLPSRSRWNLARDAHHEYRKHVKVFK